MTAAGPATLSLRTKAPILPTAVYFEGPSHRGVIESPVEYERTGKLKEQVQQLIIKIDQIRRHEQVNEIVDTDFFNDLQKRAKELRNKGQDSGGETGI